MIKISLSIIAAILGFGAISLNSFAQEKKASEFFEHDFAGKILQGQASPSPTEAAPEESERSEGVNPIPTPRPMFESEEEKTLDPSESPAPDERDRLSAHPIKSLGVILNAMKPDHAKEYVAQLASVAFKYDLPIHNIYYVGPIHNFPEDTDRLTVKLQGGSIEGGDAPPEKYPVKRSPTWIIETEKGEILLEGFLQLERFVNSKGQFVENFHPVGNS